MFRLSILVASIIFFSILVGIWPIIVNSINNIYFGAITAWLAVGLSMFVNFYLIDKLLYLLSQIKTSTKDQSKTVNEQIKTISNIFVAIAVLSCSVAIVNIDKNWHSSLQLFLQSIVFFVGSIMIFDFRKPEEI